MAASRACFELGLRVAWIHGGECADESDLRALALHRQSAAWKAKVANRLEKVIGTDGQRWHISAEAQERLVQRHLSRFGEEAELPPTVSVRQQLVVLGLERLYHGYQLASEYAHAGLGSGGEVNFIRRE